MRPSHLLAIAFMLVAATRANAEWRCGWLENPTPANFWLTDGAGTWILSTQGSPLPRGMELIPDLSEHDFIAMNSSHGYACACLDARYGADKTAIEILAFRQRPLDTCREDRSLPKP